MLNTVLPEAPASAAPPAPVAAPSFTAVDRAHFQAEDRGIAGIVVTIMGTIFLTALIAYTYIAYLSFAQPWR